VKKFGGAVRHHASSLPGKKLWTEHVGTDHSQMESAHTAMCSIAALPMAEIAPQRRPTQVQGLHHGQKRGHAADQGASSKRGRTSSRIGHLKEKHRMGRNHLANASGDATTAVLAAAGYNSDTISSPG